MLGWLVPKPKPKPNQSIPDAWVGTYNHYMRTIGAQTASCMGHSTTRHMTVQEEYKVGTRLLAAIRERPDDWEFDEGFYNAIDMQTRVQLWIANGAEFLNLRVTPDNGGDIRYNLRDGTQNKLFAAIHELRHSRTSAEVTNLLAKLDAAAPKAPIREAIEAPRDLHDTFGLPQLPGPDAGASRQISHAPAPAMANS